MDVEISKQRDQCLRKYFLGYKVRKVVIFEFGDFTGCTGDFATVGSQIARGHMDPKKWWVMYGPCALELQKLALRVLGHPSSSSCCERNWSTYSFIHSIDRHQMDPKRAEDFVYVHSNLRLLSRKI
jgi:hAT family C-terminal dimerisation region